MTVPAGILPSLRCTAYSFPEQQGPHTWFLAFDSPVFQLKLPNESLTRPFSGQTRAILLGVLTCRVC